MFFVASKVAWFFLKPLNILFGLISVGFLARWAGLRRIGTFLLIAACGAFIAGEYTNLGEIPLRALENRFPQPHLDGIPLDGIIVLGGAVESAELMAERGQPPLNDAAERMTEAVVLAEQFPQARIAFTGYSGKLVPEGSEADVARRFFADMGLAPQRLVFEERSRNTNENAIFLRDLINPEPHERWLLVTSAFHMPRSVGVFCQAGWSVTPYPVDYRTRPDESFRFVGGDGLNSLTVALREWVGLVAYRATGKTDSLFPDLGEC